jgi:hypothetical protein
MKKGCIRIGGKTLIPGVTHVVVLRRSHFGMSALFRKRDRHGKLQVNVWNGGGKLHLDPSEIEVRT